MPTKIINFFFVSDVCFYPRYLCLWHRASGGVWFRHNVTIHFDRQRSCYFCHRIYCHSVSKINNNQNTIFIVKDVYNCGLQKKIHVCTLFDICYNAVGIRIFTCTQILLILYVFQHDDIFECLHCKWIVKFNSFLLSFRWNETHCWCAKCNMFLVFAIFSSQR